MEPKVYEEIQRLFIKVATLNAHERRDYLASNCSDEQVRNRIEAMLEHDTPEAEGRLFEAVTVDPFDLDDEIGPYRILESIGEGGFCLVYLAEQTTPVVRRVALKVIKPGMDTRSVVARFEAERQALALMGHPNIANFYDFGVTAQGRGYFAMEYVPGEPITKFCDGRRLSLQERLGLFVQVCEAVQHAHHKAIIHRDLKPSNVLVAEIDGRAVPKVIDFGIAKSLEQKLTERTLHTTVGQWIGTPEYMSPEQADPSVVEIDARSDVFSLGILLHEILVGHLPVKSGSIRDADVAGVPRAFEDYEASRPSSCYSALEADSAAREADLRRTNPRDLLRRVSGDLDWITLRATAKERALRYAAPRDLAVDIERFLRGDPVDARRPTLTYRLGKLWSRHRGFVASAALIIAALAVGLVISTTQYFEAQSARLELRNELVRSEGLRLITQSTAIRSEDPDAAFLLALEAAERHDGSEARNAVLAALTEFVPHRIYVEKDTWPRTASFSPDGRLVVSAAGRGISLWDTRTAELDDELQDEGMFQSEEDYLTEATFSSDGRYVAGATYGGGVTIWDLREGVHRNLGRVGLSVLVAWRPETTRLVTVLNRGEVLVWEGADGSPSSRLGKSRRKVVDAAMSHDGRRVALVSQDNRLRIFDLEGSEPALVLPGPREAALVSVAYGPAGDRLLVTDINRGWIVDARSGEVIHRLGDTPGQLTRGLYSPDGDRILTFGGDRRSSMWDARSGDRVLELTGHTSTVIAAEFSRDGQRVVTGSIDNSAVVWDVRSGRPMDVLQAHANMVSHVTFRPDGRQVVTCSADRTIGVWDVGRRVVPRLRHERAIECYRLSRDGRSIATAAGSTVSLWSAEDGALERRLEHDHDVGFAFFSADDRVLVTITDGREVIHWDRDAGVEIKRWALPTRPYRVTQSPDGALLAVSAHKSTRATVHEMGDGQLVRTQESLEGQVSALGFSPDSRLLFVGSSLGVTFHRVDTWTEDVVLRAPQRYVQLVDFHPEYPRRKLVVTSAHDGTARVWSLDDGEELARYEHAKPVFVARFSPDGESILTATWDERGRIWNRQTGELALTLTGHEARLTSALFSPDGKLVLTTSFDHTARLWDSRTGEEVLVFNGHSERVIDEALFTVDGRRAITAGVEHAVRIWPVDPERLARDSRPRELFESERRKYRVSEKGAR